VTKIVDRCQQAVGAVGAKHRGVVDQHASFPQDSSDAAIVQGIAQMQPHSPEDDVSLKWRYSNREGSLMAGHQ
jgi:hypothetical protein